MKKIKKLLSGLTLRIKSLYSAANRLLFDRLPPLVGTPLAVLLVIAPIILAILAYHVGRHKHPSSYTVMVTNLEGNSGGSGVIISNNPSESVILTNNHVCDGVLKKGGKIRLVSGEEHAVTGYLAATEHDLCVLTVAADLKNSISVATNAPDLYAPALITGHPALMPNVITNGHFGGRQIITIMLGARKCKDSDLKDDNLKDLCLFFGKVPILKKYESQVVTATIMPGSSGSAVLNSDGELAGLVFAGNSRGLSYAYIVPFEAIRNFLNNEARSISGGKKLRPWLEEADSEEPEEDQEKSTNSQNEKILFQKRCLENFKKNKNITNFCTNILNDIQTM